MAESEREQIIRVYAASCEEGTSQIEDCLLDLEQHPDRVEVLNEAFRLCHTIKGDSGTVGFDGASRLAHVIEEAFERVRAGEWAMRAPLVSALLIAVDALRGVIQTSLAGTELDGDELEALIGRCRREIQRSLGAPRHEAGEAAPGRPESDARPLDSVLSDDIPTAGPDPFMDRRRRSLRIRIDVLDRMLDLTGELAIAHSRMRSLLSGDDAGSPAKLREAHRDMDLLFNELQAEVMRVRMVPIGPVFRQQMRTVRDLALSDGKRARLGFRGAEAELDTTVIEHVRACLGHIVRNAIAHGIESPEEREAAGKDPYGRVDLDARHEGGSIIVDVTDDGRGLDLARIRARAAELGLTSPDRPLSDEELTDLVFEPGFSTRDAATLVSGRGVGMDVVRERLQSLGGSVHIRSTPGEGSTVSLRLPLTLAIIEGFEVAVGGETYVIPLASVVECVDLSGPDEDRSAPTGVINLRGQPLPYARLRKILGIHEEPPDREGIVIVRDQGLQAGVAVDALLGESQAVIKPLGTLFRDLPGIAGSTILANGDVALILDVPELLHAALKRQSGAARTEPVASAAHL